MGRNVEIKLRVRDLEALRTRIEAVAEGAPEIIDQEDTIFHSPRGRLKLRRFSADRGELISYVRADVVGPRESRFTRSPSDDPDSLVEALTDALGVIGVVRKRRLLYRTGQTRIHLDEVAELGHFLELEVVLAELQSAEEGEQIARSLMTELALAEEDLVPQAYIDLLEQKK